MKLPLWLGILLTACALVRSEDDSLKTHLGVAVVDSKYQFTNKDLLDEGSDEILKLGSKAMKVWVVPDDHDLLKMVQSERYVKIFAKPLQVYDLMTLRYTYRNYATMSEQEIHEEYEAFYQLAKYLLEKYNGSGKTFILQNWEGDNAVRASENLSNPPAPEALENMTKWLNARQEGVDRARKESQSKNVHVYHAAECNQVVLRMNGELTVANSVIPKTHCDLYSYSCYESQYDSRALVTAVHYLKEKAPDSADFGNDNVMFGEFGWGENQTPASEIVPKMEDVIAVMAKEKVPYAFYWQLFCNEWTHGQVQMPQDKDFKGFWLIRHDNHAITPMYRMMQAFMDRPWKDASSYAYHTEKKTDAIYTVPLLKSGPVLDGNLGEWKLEALQLTVSDAHRAFEFANWTPANCSATAYLAYTPEGLWLGFDVEDDVHFQTESDGDIWREDSVQVTIDAENDKVPLYDGDDQELGFALSSLTNKPMIWAWYGVTPESLAKYKFAAVRNKTHTTYEVFIPFSELKSSKPFVAGKELGLSFIVNDCDNSTRGWIEFTEGIAKTKDPSKYPTFVLGK